MSLLLGLGLIAFRTEAQTYASGALTNTCTPTAGTVGTNFGCGAGHTNITNASTNTFIGDSAGYYNDSIPYNTAVGFAALKNNNYTRTNTAIGFKALYSQTTCAVGCWQKQGTNVAVGHEALFTSQAYGGTCVGFIAGFNNTTGCSLTGIGEEACRYNTTGDDNVGVGSAACHKNETGTANTCVGDHAADGYTTGISFSNNTFVGNGSGNLIHDGNNQNSAFGDSTLANTNASNNCAFGHMTLYANTTGTPNSGFGYQALLKNTTGKNNNAFGYQTLLSNTTGAYNSAYGDYALNSNVTGQQNVAFGYSALKNNTDNYNSAFGYGALSANTAGAANCAFGTGALSTSSAASGTGGNCAFGYDALYAATTGIYNVGIGYQASYSLTSANSNVAVGRQALYTATTGSANAIVGYEASYYQTGNQNTALGYQALFGTNAGTSSGTNNVGVGFQAGNGNTTGNYNTYVGNGATASAGTYTNATAIGNGASTTANDKMYLGNSTMAGTWIPAGVFYNGSDGRFKTNVTENVKGLAFINKLRPVTYNMNTQALDNFLIQNLPDSMKTAHKQGMDFTASTATVHSGFIAQEVEQVAQQVGFASSIVSHPANSTDIYALGYSEFVVPLVKAVQELSHLDSIKTVALKQDSINNHKQDSIITSLQNQINQIVNTCCNSSSGSGSNNRNLQNGTKGNGSNNGNNNNTSPTDSSAKLTSVNNIELSSNSAIIYQNAPNPFGDGTVIRYFVPESTTNAQIIFYDQFGSQLNIFNITTTGTGQLNVASINLAAGTYSYSLIINGKTVDTKKMIKTTN